MLGHDHSECGARVPRVRPIADRRGLVPRQAPLLLGGGVLAVDALRLLGPYAAALPRWLTLGAAGLLLVGVGATYEQRRRDVTRLRERYDALT